MPEESEPRFDIDLRIRVFGLDAAGRPFSQNVQARNISDRGAKLSGLDKQLASGDVVGVRFRDKKVRCQVVWAVDAEPARKNEVGVRLLAGQPSPWREEIAKQQATGATPQIRFRPRAKDKRTFSRRRISVQIELQDGQGISAPLRAKTADLAGGGCYIEMMQPLPVTTILGITFWLCSKRFNTAAIVRTCDPGVGMGIEFTGLDLATQKLLQRHIDTRASELAPNREPTEEVSEARFLLSSKV
jgi:PilZ domain